MRVAVCVLGGGDCQCVGMGDFWGGVGEVGGCKIVCACMTVCV